MAPRRDRVLKTVTNLPSAPAAAAAKAPATKRPPAPPPAAGEEEDEGVSELTRALEGLKLVKDKVAVFEAEAGWKEAAAHPRGRDPGAPQPATSAYRYFCQDARPRLAKRHADKSPKELGALLREQWRACSDKRRKPYVERARADRARFEAEAAAYRPTADAKQSEQRALQMFYEKQRQELALELLDAQLAANTAQESSKKKERDPDAPKRPMTNYMYFAKERRAGILKKNPSMPPTEISKVIGAEWNKLAKGKAGKKGTRKYDLMAEKDKERFEKEREAYNKIKQSRVEEEENQRRLQLEEDKEEAMKMLKAVEAEKKAAELQKIPLLVRKPPVKRALNPYLCFVAEIQPKVSKSMPQGTTRKDIMTEVGRRWQKLSKKEKQKYVAMSEKDKVRYQNEKEALEKKASFADEEVSE